MSDLKSFISDPPRNFWAIEIVFRRAMERVRALSHSHDHFGGCLLITDRCPFEIKTCLWLGTVAEEKMHGVYKAAEAATYQAVNGGWRQNVGHQQVGTIVVQNHQLTFAGLGLADEYYEAICIEGARVMSWLSNEEVISHFGHHPVWSRLYQIIGEDIYPIH